MTRLLLAMVILTAGYAIGVSQKDAWSTEEKITLSDVLDVAKAAYEMGAEDMLYKEDDIGLKRLQTMKDIEEML